ncbi:uncharacterized protein MYCFIDRAFT_198677 [Pseudocercospora fijiensis CIRAD86]|uniref:Uncharacterized protein n=1 Tax=Pseudocercospora fijiensis (strain CIRAD86) TaxID=383855 RepID=M3A750_PSEFD|nr:uncharacterized protein MYCFIDRAFT_198677 [Pseudocercospora fijiensis CIRAD86]EME80451.1 hypothetical protein MYCFIDRAFT_198677 [Pseudocercospora fijiensis CIRAD86]
MAPLSKQGSNSHDWENDSNMKKLLEKKRKAEDAELFNSEETMVLKRRAVVIAAKRTPLPRRLSDLTFDDDITPSIDTQLHNAARARSTKKPQAARKVTSKRESKPRRKSDQNVTAKKQNEFDKAAVGTQRRRGRIAAEGGAKAIS